MSNSAPGTSEAGRGWPIALEGPEHERVGLEALRANRWDFWAAVAWEMRAKARPRALHHRGDGFPWGGANGRRFRKRFKARHGEGFSGNAFWEPTHDEFYRRRPR